MQLFHCPYCGARDEAEFFFAGEVGNDRPEPAAEISSRRWAEYLYMCDNPRGESSEIWIHLTCDEAFVMKRDTLTNDVLESVAIKRGQAK